MSGHSKWSTIKRKKGANDAKRGKLFAKLIKAIEVAAKNGGTDPSANAALYQAISKAKSNSVPNDNIERALKRIDGDSDSGDIFELTYEGYGPHGVAILINCLTDNKNRTSSDVRAVLTKNNGSMGNPGSVAYLFELKASPVRAAQQGYTTSVGFSSELKTNLGLGFLRNGRARVGEQIKVVDHLRNAETICKICDPIFLDREGERARG